MIINSIKFFNFKSYYDEVKFDLSTKNERNVTIIYADNDTGKTCFFEGILFALYGPQKGQKLIELINMHAYEECKFDSYVSIFGEHNNQKIEITRKIISRYDNPLKISNKDLRDEVSIIVDGKTLRLDELSKKEYIYSIIHENASKYFFFDGEKIDAFDIASPSDYQEAITRILGLKELENAIEDMKSIYKDYEKELDKVLKGKENLREKVEDKEKLQEEIDDINMKIKAIEEEEKATKLRKLKIEDELKKYVDIHEKFVERDSLIKERNSKKDELNNAKLEISKIIKEEGTKILGLIIYDQDKRVKSILGERYEFMDDKVVSYINNLIDKKICICGKNLSEEDIKQIKSDLYKSLLCNEELLRKGEIHEAVRKLENYVVIATEKKIQYLNLNSANKADRLLN